jgi:CHAT domain-containing protein
VIFISDSLFREISISALYDSTAKKFVVDKNYSTSLVPSFQFLKEYKPFNLETTSALIVGIKYVRDDYDPPTWPLPQICHLKTIFPQVKVLYSEYNDSSCRDLASDPSVSTQMTNEEETLSFTKTNLSHSLQAESYNLIHLATHGEFDSDPRRTLIFTDDKPTLTASDRIQEYTINLLDFEKILEERNADKPIDLLVFSACETAKGDNRAVLGISGISAKFEIAGTISTLWKAKQTSSIEFFEAFYSKLITTKGDKLKALHLTQQEMLHEGNRETRSPLYWAPFVIVGY